MEMTTPPAGAPAVVVDVRTIYANEGTGDEGSSLDGSSCVSSVGSHLKAAVRDYCLGCVPPHIRRKGLAIPPFRVRGERKCTAMREGGCYGDG
jgi:hypothetical protein